MSLPNKNKKNKKNRFAIIMGIIWGIIISVLAFCLVKIYAPKEEYYYRSEYMLENVMAERYGEVYSRMESVLENGIDPEERTEYKELDALKGYMQAAGMYRIYSENGYSEEALVYEERMAQESGNLAGLSYITEEIDAMLHLTE